MRRPHFVLLSFCLIFAATLIAFKIPLKHQNLRYFGRSNFASASIVESYGRLPMTFEANEGQTDTRVRFLSRGNGYNLFLTSTEAVLSLNKSGDIQTHDPKGAVKPSGEAKAIVRMNLIDANTSPQVTGADELPGKSNYFIGSDPKKWRTNVPTYAKVRYANVYSGIDLVYYGNQRQLEYDFVVAPGADPRAIRLAIGGEEKLRIDSQGDLVLGAEGSELRLHRPVIYQEISGARQRIAGNFVIEGLPSEASAKEGRQVGFEVARYDASKPLIIDPVLSYSTYLGSYDAGIGIAVDSSGNAYVTGRTQSSNFPTSNAFQPSFGGGSGGSCGGSLSFPAPCADAFVTKLNAAGSALVYSTYLGGSGEDGGIGIAVDSSGNAYVTGYTQSTNFPTANAFQAAKGGELSFPFTNRAFVAKLNAAGSALVYSTYLGGSGKDVGRGIAVDSSGNAYVTGGTDSRDFPTTPGAFQPAFGGGGAVGAGDAFVTKFNADGSALIYSTYLGGSGEDGGIGIAVDSSGNAYVTGSTNSANFPTANAFQATNARASSLYGGNAFVTKLNAAGSALVYSTYLGGNGDGYGSSIAVDSSGNAYVTGSTTSTNFPTANAFQAALGGGTCATGFTTTSPCSDAFVTKLNAAGSALVYSTYLGGSGSDQGIGIAVDSSGNTYVTGITYSTNFPTANAFQAAFGGEWDAFVTKLNPAGSALVYSTYLGGSKSVNTVPYDSGSGIAVDSSGNAYVTGSTGSTNFPTANAFQATYGGVGGDAFVTKFPAITGGPLPPPLLPQGAVVNGASFAAGAPVAPGSIISIFGSNLAFSAVNADSTPLPTTLLTTSVTISTISARASAIPIPLYYVSPTQINAQVPFETPPGTATLAVIVNGVLSPAVTFPVAATAPGIFQYGTNRAVAVNLDGSINASDRPAKPGEVIVVYMTGQGAVSNQVPTGAPALVFPFSQTLATTTATIGGTNAEVLFSGLTPGFVGLLQANIRIPNVAAGDRPLAVTIGGMNSNTVTIAVQ